MSLRGGAKKGRDVATVLSCSDHASDIRDADAGHFILHPSDLFPVALINLLSGISKKGAGKAGVGPPRSRWLEEGACKAREPSMHPRRTAERWRCRVSDIQKAFRVMGPLPSSRLPIRSHSLHAIYLHLREGGGESAKNGRRASCSPPRSLQRLPTRKPSYA